MKTNNARAILPALAVLAMSAGGAASIAAADAHAKGDEAAELKWGPRRGRKIKARRRDADTTTTIPLAGCLTPRALKSRRDAKARGFEARA